MWRRGMFALLVVALVFGWGPPADASAGPAEAEQRFLDLIAVERASNGEGPLAVHPDLVAAARRQAAAMRDAGRLFHTSDLGSVTTGWRLLGENVGMGPDADLVHRAFMASSGHRANILEGRYTHVGVGVVVEGSTVWVAEIFMEATVRVVSSEPAFTPPFRDDDGSIHEPSIVAIAGVGITSGCAVERYCPGLPVTREQMATFLDRALDLPPTTRDWFWDDEWSPHEDAVNRLASAGITGGCGGGRFCPTDRVDRAQMASFLARAFELPPTTRDWFWDDEWSPHEEAIDRLASAGITGGCGGGRYCPAGAVTREEMASFLARAMGL